MNKFWSARARELTPYVPGEQPKDRKFIKLNTNENPYPPSPLALAAIREAACDTLRLYPDPECTSLREVLGATYGLKPAQIFVGNGSDEVLALCFQAFFDPERTILFPDITYSFYPVFADLYGLSYREVPLDENFAVPLEPFLEENGGIVIANPNAPTGRELSLYGIRAVLEANPDAVVVVDEAYVDFGAESAMPLTEKYENLLVVQTFSKSRSLAGLRIGFAMGHPRLIRALNDVKYSFNSYTMNMPSQLLGAASVGDEAYFQETVRRIRDTREKAKLRFRGLGFSFPDSQANFLFVTHPVLQARVLFEALKRERIYVRYFDAPRLDNFLRITIGTEQEMEKLFAFLEDFVKKEG